jgi:putative transposase
MYFESGGIYHIYNQGNNRQRIFFNHDNYIFFLKKIKSYVHPYGSILAWCLMPNHFHLMVEVEHTELAVHVHSDGVSQNHPVTNIPESHSDAKIRTLNDSIGIMLRSYTRAINIQQKRTGNLFREETKAICLNEIKGISSNWFTSFGVTYMNIQVLENQYPQVCFNYIHNNPVKSGLIEKTEDWEFSSYCDIKNLRDGKLINRKRIAELGLIC